MDPAAGIDDPPPPRRSFGHGGPWLVWAVAGLVLGLNAPHALGGAVPPWLLLVLGVVLGAMGLLLPGQKGGVVRWEGALAAANPGSAANPPAAQQAMRADDAHGNGTGRRQRFMRGLLLAAACAGLGAAWVPSEPTPRLLIVDAEVLKVWDGQHSSSCTVRLGAVHAGVLPRGLGLAYCRLPSGPALRPGDLVRLECCLTREEWKGAPRTVFQVGGLEVLALREVGPQSWAWRGIEALPRHRELAAALLLGRGTPPEHALFKQSGLLHVLAVSGMHVGLALVGIAMVLGLLGLGWAWRQGALVLAALGYLWLTGASIPTWRAVVMVMVLTAYAFSGRRPARLAPLSLAALVLVLLDPADGSSLSFLLSLVAVAAIVTLGRDLVTLRRRWLALQPWPLDRPIWRGFLHGMAWTLDGLLVGVAASLAVTPLIAGLGQANPWGPLATVISTPPLVLLLVAGLLWLLAQGVWPGGPWAGLRHLVEWGLDSLVATVEVLARLPGAMLTVEPPSVAMCVLWPLLFLPLRDGIDLALRGGMLGCLLLLW